jgi:hypothetical protein
MKDWERKTAVNGLLFFVAGLVALPLWGAIYWLVRRVWG